MAKKYYHKSRFQLPKDGYRGAFFRMLPAILTVGLVPLIVRACLYETELTEYAWFGEERVGYEFFLAPKSIVLMIIMFIMAGCIGVRLWKEKKKIPFAKLLIPLFIYGFLAFLSACFSVKKSFSFGGGYEQFETVWVLLGYVLVVYYVFLYATEESELRVVTDAVCFSATIIGILGTFQGLGIDFLANKMVQRLITTDRFLRMTDGLSLNFNDGQAVATMYNPNYLGVYGSFMLPFLAMLILYEKSKWRRIWHIADFVLVAVALLSSRSRAGLIAATAALCVALVVCCRRLVKYWYLTIPAVNFAVAILLLVNAYNDNLIFRRMQNIFAADKVQVEEFVAEDGTVVRETGLTELYTTENSVVMTYNDVTVHVYMYNEDGYFGLYSLVDNEEQVEMTMEGEDMRFSFAHPALSGVSAFPLMVGEDSGFLLEVNGSWPFLYNEEEGKFQYVRRYQTAEGTDVYKQSDMIMAESFGFENRQRFFSGRGYIWSRTIPLLKDRIFLGSGPDTFLLEFPQNDYLKMEQNGFGGMVMTKPHSMYLQVGVQTGVLSLLCLLVFYGWYAIWCLRLYWFRNMNTLAEGLGVSVFIASIGYMISGISNDSMVVTGPVFWTLIGLGVAANALVTKKRKEETVSLEKEKKAKNIM